MVAGWPAASLCLAALAPALPSARGQHAAAAGGAGGGGGGGGAGGRNDGLQGGANTASQSARQPSRAARPKPAGSELGAPQRPPADFALLRQPGAAVAGSRPPPRPARRQKMRDVFDEQLRRLAELPGGDISGVANTLRRWFPPELKLSDAAANVDVKYFARALVELDTFCDAYPGITFVQFVLFLAFLASPCEERQRHVLRGLLQTRFARGVPRLWSRAFAAAWRVMEFCEPAAAATVLPFLRAQKDSPLVRSLRVRIGVTRLYSGIFPSNELTEQLPRLWEQGAKLALDDCCEGSRSRRPRAVESVNADFEVAAEIAAEGALRIVPSLVTATAFLSWPPHFIRRLFDLIPFGDSSFAQRNKRLRRCLLPYVEAAVASPCVRLTNAVNPWIVFAAAVVRASERMARSSIGEERGLTQAALTDSVGSDEFATSVEGGTTGEGGVVPARITDAAPGSEKTKDENAAKAETQESYTCGKVFTDIAYEAFRAELQQQLKDKARASAKRPHVRQLIVSAKAFRLSEIRPALDLGCEVFGVFKYYDRSGADLGTKFRRLTAEKYIPLLHEVFSHVVIVMDQGRHNAHHIERVLGALDQSSLCVICDTRKYALPVPSVKKGTASLVVPAPDDESQALVRAAEQIGRPVARMPLRRRTAPAASSDAPPSASHQTALAAAASFRTTADAPIQLAAAAYDLTAAAASVRTAPAYVQTVPAPVSRASNFPAPPPVLSSGVGPTKAVDPTSAAAGYAYVVGPDGTGGLYWGYWASPRLNPPPPPPPRPAAVCLPVVPQPPAAQPLPQFTVPGPQLYGPSVATFPAPVLDYSSRLSLPSAFATAAPSGPGPNGFWWSERPTP